MANPANFLRSGSIPTANLPPHILESVLKRNGWKSPPEPVAHVPPGALVIRGIADSSTGYGRLLAHVMKGLESLGQPTAFHPVAIDETRLPLDPFIAGRKLAGKYDGPVFHVDSRPDVKGGSAAFTMWESGRLPANWLPSLNRAKCIIVPCEWNRGVFFESGVSSPVRVVPLGIDTSVYYPEEGRRGDGDFVVLSAARLAHGGSRKGVSELILAFIEALGDKEDARLHLKLWPDCEIDDPGHPRIEIDRRSYDDAGMRSLYNSATVYASMTKGEGFGLPVIEGMACGLPYLGPIHTGIADFATEECSYPVEWAAQPAGGVHYKGHGEWFVPRHDSMVAQLHTAYTDRGGRQARGMEAAQRAREFTWDRTATELLAVLREFDLVPCNPNNPKSTGKVAVRPEIVHQLKLGRLREACPNGTKPPGCGCNDELICSIGNGVNGRASRQACYACIEAREKPDMKDAASVGHDIFVGPLEACDRLAGTDFRFIHLWSDQNRDEDHLCKSVRAGSATLAAKWTEGQSLAELSVPIDEIAEFADRPGRLLVHCRSGSCRSTAVALIAKVARGCEPFQAIKEIGEGMYRDRHMYPGWFQHNVLGILDWAAKRAKIKAKVNEPESALAGSP